MPAERIITEQPFPMESSLLMCLVMSSITKVLTPLSLHQVHIMPIVIAIIYGCIQGKAVALQSVQIHCSRTRMWVLTFFRTLSMSGLQSCIATIPTASSALCGCIKTSVKWDQSVSEIQMLYWWGPFFLSPRLLCNLRACCQVNFVDWDMNRLIMKTG